MINNCHQKNNEETFTQDKIIKILDDDFLDAKYFLNSKSEYLAEVVFELAVYDESICEKLATKILDVIESILEGKTFQYIQLSEKHYEDFILLCNIPFLAEKIEWGTSIRGAWFDDSLEYKITLSSSDLLIPKEQICVFMRSLLFWKRNN